MGCTAFWCPLFASFSEQEYIYLTPVHQLSPPASSCFRELQAGFPHSCFSLPRLSLDVWSLFDFVPLLTTQCFAKLLHLLALQNKLNVFPNMQYAQGQVSGVKAEGSEGFPKAQERHKDYPACPQAMSASSAFRKATWFRGRCPCSWQGGWKQMIFKVPSNPNHSMILWFYERRQPPTRGADTGPSSGYHVLSSKNRCPHLEKEGMMWYYQCTLLSRRKADG